MSCNQCNQHSIQCDSHSIQGDIGSAQSVRSRWQSRGYWLGTISAIQVAVKGILVRHNQCDPGGSQGDIGSAQSVRSRWQTRGYWLGTISAIQVAVKEILARHNQCDSGGYQGHPSPLDPGSTQCNKCDVARYRAAGINAITRVSCTLAWTIYRSRH